LLTMSVLASVWYRGKIAASDARRMIASTAAVKAGVIKSGSPR